MSSSLDLNLLPLVADYLSLGDIKAVKLVCQSWCNVVSIPRYFKNSIINITGSLNDDRATNQTLEEQYEYLINSRVMQLVQSVCYRNAGSKVGDFANPFWTTFGPQIKSLKFQNVIFKTDRELEHVLSLCSGILELRFEGCVSSSVSTEQSNVPFYLENLQSISFTKCCLTRYMYDQLQHRTGPIKCLKFDKCFDKVEDNGWKYPPCVQVLVVRSSRPRVSCIDFVRPFIVHHSRSLISVILSNMCHLTIPLDCVLKTEGLSLEKLHMCEEGNIFHIPGTLHQQTIEDLAIQLPPMDRQGLINLRGSFPTLKKFHVKICSSEIYSLLNWVSEMKELEHLQITIPTARIGVISDIALNLPEGLRVLKFFNIPNRLTNVNLDAPALPVHLRELHLSCPEMVNDDLVQNICRWLNCLKILNLSDCSKITDVGLVGDIVAGVPSDDGELGGYCRISNLKSLKVLNLFGCVMITDISLKYGIKFKELKALNLSKCSLITDEGVSALAGQIPSLEVLKIRNCLVSNGGLTRLFPSVPRLTTLDAVNGPELTPELIDDIVNFCPMLRSVFFDVPLESVLVTPSIFGDLRRKLPRCVVSEDYPELVFEPRICMFSDHNSNSSSDTGDSDSESDVPA